MPKKIGDEFVYKIYMWANHGLRVEQLCERFDLSESEVNKALDYAEDNEKEIEKDIREEEEIFLGEENKVGSRVNFISVYTPDTFLKPILLISTVYGNSNLEEASNSTAILFGEALNKDHLLAKIYMTHRQRTVTEVDNETLKVSEFYEVKPHNSRKSAIDFHSKFIENLNIDKYEKLYERYCPEELKRKV